MIERPILMCGEMVVPTLDDRKTQTRRVVTDPELIKLFNYIGGDDPAESDKLSISFLRDSERTDETKTWRYTGLVVYSDEYPEEGAEEFTCPYGVPGDRLWVKETHWRWGRWSRGVHKKTGKPCWNFKPRLHPSGSIVEYSKPDGPKTPPNGTRAFRYACRWHQRPSIFMRRKDSRITLEIVSIRVERVQDISEEDAMAEGVNWQDYAGLADHTARKLYRKLWDSLNKDRGYGWDVNPLVFVISFKRINP